MEPVTIGLLLAGGAALAKRAGAATSAYIANKPSEAAMARVSDLEALQNADALGLTGAERQAYLDAVMHPQQALAREGFERTQALQSMAGGSGEYLRRATALEEQETRAAGQAAREIAVADIQKAEAQEQELLALQMGIEQQEQAQKAAVWGGIIGGVGDVMSTGSQYFAMAEMANRGGPMIPGAGGYMGGAPYMSMYGYGAGGYPPNPYGYGMGAGTGGYPSFNIGQQTEQ